MTKTLRNYLESFKEKVTDKWGKTHTTRITWVDVLPIEYEDDDDFLEKNYSGYRSMTICDHVNHINDFIAIRTASYNGGASGYHHYNAEIYVRKDFWQNFHLPESIPEATEAWELKRVKFYDMELFFDKEINENSLGERETCVEIEFLKSNRESEESFNERMSDLSYRMHKKVEESNQKLKSWAMKNLKMWYCDYSDHSKGHPTGFGSTHSYLIN